MTWHGHWHPCERCHQDEWCVQDCSSWQDDYGDDSAPWYGSYDTCSRCVALAEATTLMYALALGFDSYEDARRVILAAMGKVKQPEVWS